MGVDRVEMSLSWSERNEHKNSSSPQVKLFEMMVIKSDYGIVFSRVFMTGTKPWLQIVSPALPICTVTGYAFVRLFSWASAALWPASGMTAIMWNPNSSL